MNKKKILLIAAAAVLVFYLIVGLARTEDAASKKLRQEIESADANCPANVGMMGQIEGMKYDEEARKVTMTMILNEEVAELELLRNHPDPLGIMKMSTSVGDSKNMLQDIVDAGAGLTIVVKGSRTGDRFEIKATEDDLRDAIDNPMTDEEKTRQVIDTQLAVENSRCPYDVDEGLTVTKVYDDGTNIVYDYRVDESMYDFELVEAGREDLRQGMVEMFPDPVINSQLKRYHALGRGLSCRYYGSLTGAEFAVTFTPEELRGYFN